MLVALASRHQQTQLQETQRLKQLADMECQKAAAAALHARSLEVQLAASAAAVQDAQRSQVELQQQVTRLQLSDNEGAEREKQLQLQRLVGTQCWGLQHASQHENGPSKGTSSHSKPTATQGVAM